MGDLRQGNPGRLPTGAALRACRLEPLRQSAWPGCYGRTAMSGRAFMEMPLKATGKHWEDWGKKAPYSGVATDAMFRKPDSEALEEFFLTGERHFVDVMPKVRSFRPGFQPSRAIAFGCGAARNCDRLQTAWTHAKRYCGASLYVRSRCQCPQAPAFLSPCTNPPVAPPGEPTQGANRRSDADESVRRATAGPSIQAASLHRASCGVHQSRRNDRSGLLPQPQNTPGMRRDLPLARAPVQPAAGAR